MFFRTFNLTLKMFGMFSKNVQMFSMNIRKKVWNIFQMFSNIVFERSEFGMPNLFFENDSFSPMKLFFSWEMFGVPNIFFKAIFRTSSEPFPNLFRTISEPFPANLLVGKWHCGCIGCFLTWSYWKIACWSNRNDDIFVTQNSRA